MASTKSPEDGQGLAYHLFAKGKYEEAIQHYQKVLDLTPQDARKADISLELGWLLYEVSRRTEAQTLAQNALLLSNQPKTLKSLLSRGAAYALLAHCLSFTDPNASAESGRMGLEMLEQVMSESSENEQIVSACHLAARIHNLLGSTDKTVALCEKCLQCEQGERERLECMIVLAEALRCEERFQEAERAIDCALQHVGTDKEYKEADKRVSQRLALERGLIQRLSNRFPNAIETFRQMLVEVEADPVLYKDSSISGTIWWNLAAVLYETSDYEGAAAAFEKALTLHPHDEPYHHKILQSLGDCYFGIAAYAKAREAYEKVIASAYSWDAEKLKACAGVAKVLYKSGMYAQAASAFETVLPDCRNDGPDYYNFLLWLGGCYEGMRNIAKARDNYEKVANATCVWDADKISAQEALMRLSSSGGSQVRH